MMTLRMMLGDGGGNNKSLPYAENLRLWIRKTYLTTMQQKLSEPTYRSQQTSLISREK